MAITFTDRELEVMNVLWDEGSATVNEARERLGKDQPYTSVLSIFQTLEEKGHIRHEREGRAYRYYPLVEREEAGRRALRYVLDRLFKGSPEALVTSLVSNQSVSESELRELSRILEGRLDEGPANP